MKRRHSMPFGAEVSDEGLIRFALWAPDADRVEVCLNQNHYPCLPMHAKDNGWYTLETENAEPGQVYAYRIDGEQLVPDPASRFQPQGVHGPSQIVDPTLTDWRDGSWHGRPWSEAVIYELHIGTFTSQGNLTGLTEKLDYLASLGVTAIELMPLAEFSGSRNWGYDGTLLFSPSHHYGTPEQLKTFIQEAHERNLMVLLDVVYNHFGPDGNYLHLYASDFFTQRHQTPWGDGINFDGDKSRPVRDFFIHNALYWIEEYHLDGLRLDAVHAITDDSPTPILDELAQTLRTGPGRDRVIHLVLENDRNEAKYLRKRQGHPLYDAQWNDDFHHSLHSLITGEAEGYYADVAKNPHRHLARCLTEGFAWQGEISPYRGNRPRGEPSADIPPTAFVSFLQNHDQIGNRAFGERIDNLTQPQAVRAAMALQLLCPSPPLFFMGEEFAAPNPFQYFCDYTGALGRSVTEGRRREFAHFSEFSGSGTIPDPNDPKTFMDSKLNWDALNQQRHSSRLSHFKKLMKLRDEAVVPGLSGPLPVRANYHLPSGSVIQVTWRLCDSSRLTIVANLSSQASRLKNRPDSEALIYSIPPIQGPETKTLPAWSINVYLEAGTDSDESRQSTIAALQDEARKDQGRPASLNATQNLTCHTSAQPTGPSIPTACYRLQLNREFGFRHLTALVPYLRDLGVSHCYCSPYLRARPGSPHGYDITDHRSLNPEIGTREDFLQLVDRLQAEGMGHILDMVPNHMGVMGRDNHWWLDVLENGPASRYSQYFDIDWQPLRYGMRNKVLLPLLGDHYGNVLDNGELTLKFYRHSGTFTVEYYEHCFPVDPQQYAYILKGRNPRFPRDLQGAEPTALEFQSLVTAFENLPPRDTDSPARREDRHRDKELLKQRLAELHQASSAVASLIQRRLDQYNGTQAQPADLDLFHELLERQAYRLAYWRVASDEINYRRFFDINDLACLRVEDHTVYCETHELVFDLLAKGQIQGLRIDHPDGLYHPSQYFEQLQAEQNPSDQAEPPHEKPLYLLAEKILTGTEPLRTDWPIHGTTGYEFAALCTGLFVDNASADYLQRVYEDFIGQRMTFDDTLYQSKKLIIETSLASGLTVLAQQLSRLSEADPHTRDFTFSGLRQALMEVIASFPVYRTYMTEDSISPVDESYIERAVDAAKRRSRAADISVFDFVRDILLRQTDKKAPQVQEGMRRFSMRFQQYTSPVMAKGLEDTSFYRYNRLLALNDVGFDPSRFGVDVQAFHHANIQRLADWPHSLTTSSTHDSKRSADVRARISVLSEVPDLWAEQVSLWANLNEAFKTSIDGHLWPDRNLEYALYQNLIGIWPFEPPLRNELHAIMQRLRDYTLKAAREAKQHTSWININEGYEQALKDFISRTLSTQNRAFLELFNPFQRAIAQVGAVISLSQLLVKMTVPGVPDTYQGEEIWQFHLVDPDNRRTVDYQSRHRILKTISASEGPGSSTHRLRAMVKEPEDGSIKCYLTWKALSLRRRYPALFATGNYIPLTVQGSHKEHLCAFARNLGELSLIVVVPRLLARLFGLYNVCLESLASEKSWGDTQINLPDKLSESTYTHWFSGQRLQVCQNDSLKPAFLFEHFPVAALIKEQ